jgi:hypothetical protein
MAEWLMADAREASVLQAMDGSETLGNSAGSASAIAAVNVDGNTNPSVEQKNQGRRSQHKTSKLFHDIIEGAHATLGAKPRIHSGTSVTQAGEQHVPISANPGA